MKKIKLFLTIGLSSLFLSSCTSYNEMVPSWAEICSNPVDKSKAAWYKPCNLSAPKFEKVNLKIILLIIITYVLL